MNQTAFYILFVVGFTILAFLIGTGLAFAAMSGRIERPEPDGEGTSAH